MAKLRSPSGDLAAQRNADGAKFFGRKIKNAGAGTPGPVFMPMAKVRLAQTGASVGSLPKGANTTGGVVGGLNERSDYQGKKAGPS